MRGILRLYDAMDGEVVLISRAEWHFCRAESGYHEVDAERTISLLRSLSACGPEEARFFGHEVGLHYFDLGQTYDVRMHDMEVIDVIVDAIRDHRVVVVQRGAAPSSTKSATADLRRLVEQIDRRGKLLFRGRQYKLVVADELGRLASRDRYEVVTQANARDVLDQLAKESPGSAEVLREASEKVSKDWRSSVSSPEGVVLVRLVQARAFFAKDDESVPAPSPKGGPSGATAPPPVEEEACRPCASLRDAKQAEALRQASKDGSPFCADCGTPPAAAS